MNGKIVSLPTDSDAFLVSKQQNIFYLTGFDGFSKEEREAYLFLTKRDKYIFTDGRYAEAVRKKIRSYKLVQISQSKKLAQIIKDLTLKEKVKNVAIEQNDIRVSELNKIKAVAKILPSENPIEKMREVKSSYEIEQVKKACKITDLTFKYILDELKKNVSEKEIAKKIEIFILSKGGSISFSPIVAFGANSSSPHHVPTDKKLSKNTIVLIDFGVKFNNYCSDMTRTVFFGGITKKQENIYNTVLEAQQKTVEYIKTHDKIIAGDIDKTAREYILSKGFPSIPHSLGHGIGIEVHELPTLSPNSTEELKKGMIFSIEPGIYIPNFGGVRIEDLYYYDGKNPQLISRAEKQIIII